MKNEILIERTPGGIPVVMERLPSSHSASFSVYFGHGSRDETKEQAGIAHMLEHMLFKGTVNRTAKQMAEEIESAGGETNGYTTKEVTTYQSFSLDETVGIAQDILADMVLNPKLDKDCLVTEKNVVTQEIRMLENDPEENIHVQFLETLWGEHPMGRSEAGSAETVASLTVKDVRSFFEERYRPPYMAVVATGNIEHAQVVDWAGRSFDYLERSNGNRSRDPPKPLARFMVYPRDDAQAYVGMGFPGLSTVSPDRFAQRLLTSVLGMGTSSRLFQAVRERSGLVYEIFSSSASYTDCGAVSVFYNTSVKDQEKVARLVAQEIRKLKTEGLEEGELMRAKRLVKGIYVRRLESTETRMVRLGEMFMSTGNVLSADEYLKMMDQVTEEQVVAMADRLMDRKKLSIAMHAPGKESEKAAKNLEDLDF
ncbi:MAG: insulinase family protein [Methanomassiliicoccus sp.]|nr:insulinase family protein [Methanomassiliicoccus sp.]